MNAWFLIKKCIIFKKFDRYIIVLKGNRIYMLILLIIEVIIKFKT